MNRSNKNFSEWIILNPNEDCFKFDKKAGKTIKAIN